MPITVTTTEFLELAGRDFEPSSWLELSQQRVNQFADATNDHQFIHVDPEKAALSPFGGPIVHGYLLLSLLPYLNAEKAKVPENTQMVINYGSDKIRFLQPVPVGSRIRALQHVKSVTQKGQGRYLVRNKVTIEIENSKKAALIAETLGLIVTGE